VYFRGIDVGSLTAEGVLLGPEGVVASVRRAVRPDPVDSAEEIVRALESAGQVAAGEVSFTIATGYGRERLCAAGIADKEVSEISCHGYGAFCAAPTVRTIVDVGGQDAKAIRVDARGGLSDFAMNDKCAAGTGHFLEHMCRTLSVDLEELGPLARRSRKPAHMSSRCTIFVETEVIHFLQRGASRQDVAAGVCRALAERVVTLVRRVGLEKPVTMTGGVAKNVAVRGELEHRLGVRMVELFIDPQLVGAFGAARLAARERGA